MPKVLIVEDSPTQALRTRITLESQGFEVSIVNDSRQALDTAKAENPDVVLSDVRMPGLDGFQLTEAFRADPAVAATAIVLPRKFPKTAMPLIASTVLLTIASLAAGCYIAYAGGKIRHREFRTEPPPPKPVERTE